MSELKQESKPAQGQNTPEPWLTREVLRKIHFVYFVLLALALIGVAVFEVLA